MDKKETEKKIVADVEERGDCAFASGDILHWAKDGYLYFEVGGEGEWGQAASRKENKTETSPFFKTAIES